MSATQPHTILVVDDDRDVRETLAEVLQDEGFEVRRAANGREALDELRADSARPCLILLDLMMPVMDGWEFRREQVRDPSLAEIPVVVVTADGRAHQKASAMNVADGLPKPVRLKDLLETIGRFCDRGRALQTPVEP